VQISFLSMAGLLSWSLSLGAAASPLETDLQVITDSASLIPDVAALCGIVVASHDANERCVIMSHLQDCLSESKGKRWRRILGSLIIVEHLMEKGCGGLISEISEGRHFDLGQRLWFLQSFEYTIDTRVQNMVRQKASTLRPALLKKMEEVETSGDSSERKHAVLSGAGVNIVVAGHCEDTDTESDCDVAVRSQCTNHEFVSVLRGSRASRKSVSAQRRVRFSENLMDGDSDGSASTVPSAADTNFGTATDLLDLF